MNKTYHNVLIIGATSLIAQHCSRLLALEQKVNFFLVVRNKNKMVEIVSDIKVRNPHSFIKVYEIEKQAFAFERTNIIA